MTDELPAPRRWPDPDWTGWPDAKTDEQAQVVFAGKVDARKLRVQAAIDRAKAVQAADLAQNAEFQKALIEITKGGFDRTRANAETVQKAAGVIGTIYTGALAAAFSVADRPLPPRGMLPALFLGLAVALSTGYLAYLASHGRSKRTPTGVSSDPRGLRGQFLRVELLAEAVSRAVRRRSYLMRCAVLALTVGVITLPVGFIALPEAGRAPAAVPDWPMPAAQISDPELAKVRYEAEVSERARQRERALVAGTEDIRMLAALAAVGLAVVFGGGAARLPQKRRQVPTPVD